ncbi:class I SAM-dependent methyltransferase [Paenibacillus sp. N3/727]|uniref:class I SAM-dependent methyltransferase n=1 Tax=Paenibacillus sp. N3/727 TaxID=2925845 RepID=UPI001F531655|nr:class I SAM-dependent methyltransferase [Paenibacillus sp. N3/727]UNK19176.1 class I SAM-dependent methyltransferase [Paenibacillus sp. N3/727]
MNKDTLVRKFNKQASMYERNSRQRMLGMWRSRLLQDVHGKVLEVAVGAGANFPYYNRDTVDLTAVDFSPEMLNSARRMALELQLEVSFQEQDIETLELPERSFDCVVSTLSLCGYDDPLAVLNKMNRWCRPGGRICLLEHGISSNRLLGFTQHLVNPVARRISGCHFNRDMLQIVHDSEVEVVNTERYYGGMIHLIWAVST